MNPAPAAPTPRAEEIPDSVATYSGPVDLEAALSGDRQFSSAKDAEQLLRTLK